MSTGSASFEALGGIAVVAVTDAAALESALAVVRDTVAAFDLACSSYRADSELSAVNAAAGAPVGVSELFLDAVQEALRGARLSNGDVDPTVGEALVAYGFFDASAPKGKPQRSFRLARGHETVLVDRAARTVTVPQGIRLDLGATAKALAADRAAAAASASAGCGVLVSLSGDLSICGEAPAGGWPVRVTDDHRAELTAPGQWIELRGGGLATSSTTARRREDGGESTHHLIDPAPGRPAVVHFRTVSVAAATCLDANIASTAAIIRGEPAVHWLESHRLPSRLVRADGTAVHVAGWPAGREELPLELAGNVAGVGSAVAGTRTG
jgi:thiamine biosynthesis lipoprotein